MKDHGRGAQARDSFRPGGQAEERHALVNLLLPRPRFGGAARFQADAHEGIQAFVAAQDVLQQVANHVNGFVTKTLEKGSVPTAEEVFGAGGCGEGCGCH